jgi:hypothetical protein
MRITDFSSSFFTFRINVNKLPPTTMTHKPLVAVNNARILIDCRCRIKDKQQGEVQEFYLGANCKGERVGVKEDVWTKPYCDFVPTFSQNNFILLKTFDTADRQDTLYPPSLGFTNERHVGSVSEAFESVRINLRECEGKVLTTTEETIHSVLGDQPLVGLTEIDDQRYSVILEYPIKTINASEVDQIYQTDTGPVLFPDLSLAPEDLVGGFQLAFSSFSDDKWVEFILRAKTPVAKEVSVYHYCKPLRLRARNTLIHANGHCNATPVG